MLHIKIKLLWSEAYCRQQRSKGKKMWKYDRAVKEELRTGVLLIILLFCSDFSYQMDLQLTSADSSVTYNTCSKRLGWRCAVCVYRSACRFYLCLYLSGASPARMSQPWRTGPKWSPQRAADPVTSSWNVDSAAIGKSKTVWLPCSLQAAPLIDLCLGFEGVWVS